MYDVYVNNRLVVSQVRTFEEAMFQALFIKGKEDHALVTFSGSTTARCLELLPESDPRAVWMRTVYLPHYKLVSGDVSDPEACDPGQLDCFLEDTGRYPYDGAELDAYTNSSEEWEAYKAAH